MRIESFEARINEHGEVEINEDGKLTASTQALTSIEANKVETSSKIEEAKKLENLIEGKDSTNSEDGSDKADTIKITIGGALSDVVSKSLADRIMDRLSDGLKGVFEEALKINDILDTFHNNDSLLKDIA